MENCLCHPQTSLSIALPPSGVPDPSRRFDTVRRTLFAEFMRVVVAGDYPIRQLAGNHAQSIGDVIPEAWAIISEILAFYDVLITRDLYIGSALQRVVLQRLTDLLGYLPRPAVGASAHVALLGTPLETPSSTAGLTLRASLPSPQVFEPDEIKSLSWVPGTVTLAPIPVTEMSFNELDDRITFLLDAATATPQRGAPVLFRHGYRLRATAILDTKAVQELDDITYVELTVTNPKAFGSTLSPPLLGSDVDVRNVSIMSPSQRAFLRTSIFNNDPFQFVGTEDMIDLGKLNQLDNNSGGYGPNVPGPQNEGDISPDVTAVVLDGVYRSIKTADLVIVQKGPRYYAHRVVEYNEIPNALVGNDSPTLPLTVITVNPPIDAAIIDSTSDKFIIHYNFHDIGRLVQPAHSELTPDLLLGKNLPLEGVHHAPAKNPYSGQWLLEDANGAGALVDATLDVGTRGKATLKITKGDWPTKLRVPVVAHPNILHVTRGETVKDEVLGNGNPMLPSQSFELKKSPLTYLPADGAPNGIKSTLEVRVDDVMWHEVRTFYGTGPNDRVYIVRQDDDEKSTITFGDGIRGARLPAGVRNVRATYRFGAGAAAPPYGNLTQIVRGIRGLTRVRNPVPAAGGADREDARELRKNAPASALILGRCVSLPDFSARVATTTGVLNSKVELAWDEAMLSAVVKVWYIPTVPDDPEIADRIVADLQALTEPGTLIQAQQAVPIVRTMRYRVIVDRDYIPFDRAKAIKAALLDPDTGPLAITNTPIGGTLSRSALAAVAMQIPGVVEIVGIRFVDQEVLNAPGELIGSGHYLDYSGANASELLVFANKTIERDCCDLGS